MERAATSAEGIAPASTNSTTVADLLPIAAERHAQLAAVTFKDQEAGGWVKRSFAEVGETVRELSLGLIGLGVAKGDAVSILANTRPEWTYYDFAALTAGATVVPIYQTNSPEECEYVLSNSDAKVVIVEDDEQLAKVDAVRARLPKLEHVIRMTGSGGNATSTEDLIKGGAGVDPGEWEKRWRSVTPDDICTIIYTSGTTGPPKGCVLSHGNYRSMVTMANEQGVLEEGSTNYLYLPLAHSFALLIELLSFDLGGCIAYWQRDAQKIVPDLIEIKPAYFPSVPRIFEKIYTAATSGVEKQGAIKKKIFNWSIRVGRKVRERERAGKSIGPLLSREYAFADKQVLSKVRALFGGEIKQCVTGAAPINPEILRFFDAAGVLVLEGWGMTETATAATISTPQAFKFGTVGKAFTGCELRIADDGEILVRGPNVFRGYYKNPEATAETLVDGWLHTGDIGELDSEGYLKITGRKKDIIITAGGKNITPANLEAEIKQSQWVSQCVVIGDRRPYLVALVTLDEEEVAKLAAEKGWPADPAEISKQPEIREMIQHHLDEINEKFARVEQVKKFEILPHDLSQESGELTPTLKVKRNIVSEKYEAQIEGLYSG